MNIWLKCTFKNSSLGYRSSLYKVKEKTLVCGRDCDIQTSQGCTKIFDFEINKTMILSTDEDGKLIFCVLGLVEGDDEKYVNAIFESDDSDWAYQAFVFFCHNPVKANQLLLECVEYSSISECGYEVKKEMIVGLCSELLKQDINIELRNFSEDKLIAFISQNTYEGYEFNIKEIYGNKDFILCDKADFNVELLDVINAVERKITQYTTTKEGRKIAVLFCIVVVIVYLIIGILNGK